MTANTADQNDSAPLPALQQALRAVRVGNMRTAEDCLTAFIARKFDLDIQDGDLNIRQDTISLNSVNGLFTTADGQKFFFKFHLEEDEGDTVAEYYRAGLLDKAGYPVEQPCYVSTTVGEQILIYPYVAHTRLFDACKNNEQADKDTANAIITAQQQLDRLCADKAQETMTIGTQQDYEAEPLLQLFYWRLVDTTPNGDRIGGRHKQFYIGKTFAFPNDVTLSYDDLSALTWNINGIDYDITLDQAFANARETLAPHAIDTYPACTAHGDAHNGNVWLREQSGGTYDLAYFDPAFAGEKIPVLLAEIKTTFHNILAHPEWLYDAKDADNKLDVRADVKDGKLYVRHDWDLPPLRRAFLDSKIENFWKPVLAQLAADNTLPENWEAFIRAALFCCPALVMNLRAGEGTAQNTHTQKTSLLGLSIAIMCATRASNGDDVITDFINRIQP